MSCKYIMQNLYIIYIYIIHTHKIKLTLFFYSSEWDPFYIIYCDQYFSVDNFIINVLQYKLIKSRFSPDCNKFFIKVSVETNNITMYKNMYTPNLYTYFRLDFM